MPPVDESSTGGIALLSQRVFFSDFSHIKYLCKKLSVRKWCKIPNFTALIIHVLLDFVTHASFVA